MLQILRVMLLVLALDYKGTMNMQSILANAEVYIIPGYGLNTQLLFDTLLSEVNWTNYSNRTRRMHCTMGRDYCFSGRMHKAEVIHPYIQRLMDRINKDFNLNLNSVYINYYPDASTSLAFHTDREKQLVEGSTVVSLSLGASRNFWFKCVKTKRERCWLLEDGDLCIMGKDSQVNYQHGLKADKELVGSRISITFREFKEELSNTPPSAS